VAAGGSGGTFAAMSTALLRVGCAVIGLSAFAGMAGAHVIYTTGFEVGQTAPGPLRGQDLWSSTPGNRFEVTTMNPGMDDQSIRFAPGGNGTSLANRPTMEIAMHGWPGMTMLMLSAMVRLDDVRPTSEVNFQLMAVDEVPGGALTVGLQNGRAFVSSQLHMQPFVLGPAIAHGRWVEIMLQLDMATGDVMGMVDGEMFGMFHIPTHMLEMDAASGITMNAEFFTDGPGAESLGIDAVTVMHMAPSPGAVAAMLMAAPMVSRRRRR
jgi:hypothetical protein